MLGITLTIPTLGKKVLGCNSTQKSKQINAFDLGITSIDSPDSLI